MRRMNPESEEHEEEEEGPSPLTTTDCRPIPAMILAQRGFPERDREREEKSRREEDVKSCDEYGNPL